MKTLDEVIRAVHHRGLITGFDDTYEYDGGCPYEDCSKCEQKRMLGKDILHYLKEYQKTVTNCHEFETGFWIPVDSETVNGRCSLCGYESHLYENDVYGEHYCPNCGGRLALT